MKAAPNAGPEGRLVNRGFLGQGFPEIIRPGPDNGRNPGFQGLAVDGRRLPFPTADNVMRAGERPFGIGGIGRGDPTLIDPREVLANPEANLGVVPVFGT